MTRSLAFQSKKYHLTLLKRRVDQEGHHDLSTIPSFTAILSHLLVSTFVSSSQISRSRVLRHSN